jgi:hypothetical protein
MKKLVVTSDIPHRGIERLKPCNLESDSGWEICYNPEPGTRCDYWVVFSYPRPDDSMICSPCNTAYVAGEPPTKKVYSKNFYRQFSKVVSYNKCDPHHNVTETFAHLNWHVGLDLNSKTYEYGYNELMKSSIPAKENRISVICSNLKKTEGQKKRLRFLEFLKENLGSLLVHFGKGFVEIDDKMNAILPFKYNLVLENDSMPYYWTEKLADAYLGYAFPFYYGCTNIFEQFEYGSLKLIDLTNPLSFIKELRDAINGNLWSKQKGEIISSRNRVLNEYNFFSQFINLAQENFLYSKKVSLCSIEATKYFRKFPLNYYYRLRRKLGIS